VPQVHGKRREEFRWLVEEPLLQGFARLSEQQELAQRNQRRDGTEGLQRREERLNTRGCAFSPTA